jgi:Dihydroorotase and related cyclic amidohydrolases
VQHAVLMLFDLASRGEIGVTTIVQRAAHAPAVRFRVAERGFLREGYFADLTLVDPKAETTVTPESLHYKCGWSPLAGHRFLRASTPPGSTASSPGATASCRTASSGSGCGFSDARLGQSAR